MVNPFVHRKCLIFPLRMLQRLLLSGCVVFILGLTGIGKAAEKDEYLSGRYAATLPGTIYQYDPKNRRDPFQPLDKRVFSPTTPTDQFMKSEESPKGLRVLGIVSGAAEYHALLESENGQKYVVKAGTVLESLEMRVDTIDAYTVIVSHDDPIHMGKKIKIPIGRDDWVRVQDHADQN